MKNTRAFHPARVAALLSLVSGLVLPAISSGFEFLPYKWAQKRAPYSINPNFPATVGTAAQVIEILRCGADGWRSQTAADFQFDYRGTTNIAKVDLLDGINAVFFTAADGNGIISATFYDGVGDRYTGFDTLFYGNYAGNPFKWHGLGAPKEDEFDLRHVALHEFGHGVGLDHSKVMEAVMYGALIGNGLTRRVLFDDDRAGIESLYGKRPGAQVSPLITRITPNQGPSAGGNEVLLEGENFTWEDDTRLSFGPVQVPAANLIVEICSRLKVTRLPRNTPGLVDVTITNKLGTFTLRNGYTFGAGFEVIAVEPDAGPLQGGIPVRVSGNKFTPDTRVSIGGAPLESPRLADGRIEGILPPGKRPGPADVQAIDRQETSILKGGFTYKTELLRAADAEIPSGQKGLADIRVATGEHLRGLSLALRFNPRELLAEGLATAGTWSEGAELLDVRIDAAAGTLTCILYLGYANGFPKIIPRGPEVTVGRIALQALGAAGLETLLHFEDIPGAPPAFNVFWDTGLGALIPVFFDGKVKITAPAAATFSRGDANGDGLLDISDAVYLLNALFLGGPAPPCPDAADADDDGAVEMNDAVFFLLARFAGGEPPPAPYPDPGVDPTPDLLECQGG
ncbi:MAG: IPT/TIG domain-containing protein [Planctomycetes bacterium]|nr:IPT/TIG domain-containing protein [Planctomycetota bacterium]